MKSNKPVKTKKDFVRRFMAGEFGNKGPNWESIKDWTREVSVRERNSKLYHIRSKTKGGNTLYNIQGADLLSKLSSSKKLFPDGYYLAEMAPHDKNLIQGEVLRTHRGLEITYSDIIGCAMRDAMRLRTLRQVGLGAKLTLQRNLCPNSWDWLNHLLDTYDNHVVEFSSFEVAWGTIPGYNTVFWEVRSY